MRREGGDEKGGRGEKGGDEKVMKSFLVGGTKVVYYLKPCSQALDYFQWYLMCKHRAGK